MRIHNIIPYFRSLCVVLCFILCVFIQLSVRLPSPEVSVVTQLRMNKLSTLDLKFKRLEKGINEHQSTITEIKDKVKQIVAKSQEYNRNQMQREAKDMKKFKKVKNIINRELPARKYEINGISKVSLCLIGNESSFDVQMLSVYEKLKFDDRDGGDWKQGWNIKYDEKQWNSKNKLKVFIVPHSHKDPGWRTTFENYYKRATKAMFTIMVSKMSEDSTKKFIWAETSFLAMWWNVDATKEEKTIFKRLLINGQIEIVTGGWVMNDEALSHWHSIIQQLTTGHQWLLNNLDYIPKNSWSIDPFGYSSSQPYLLNLAEFDNSVIQRVHYRIKKELASHKQLEFKWRQLWDGVGDTDMFTHLMPFFSYDVSHSCGPDAKICCQFDFKRSAESKISDDNCEWGVPPTSITHENVEARAWLILDQWRKKAQLYRSNVVLFPLGDDFRYVSGWEWDKQYQNYQMLIDYINQNEFLNAEVHFGTLEDYFKAVHEETKLSDFPVLSGDFFTYADRKQHYWSGYYTTRPFYKQMDRVLLAYVRAAEIITAQAALKNAIKRTKLINILDLTEHSRQILSLFQHHDAITGTNKVPDDYGRKMLKAIKACQSVIRDGVFFLKRPIIQKRTTYDYYFNIDDVWDRHDKLPSRLTIALDRARRSRVALYNALAFRRTEVLTVLVSSPYVEVQDSKDNPVHVQISPVVVSENHLSLAASKYQLSFPVTVGPLDISVYTIKLRDVESVMHATYAVVRVYNADLKIYPPYVFSVDHNVTSINGDITLELADGTTVVTTSTAGLIKRITFGSEEIMSVQMAYVQYTTSGELDNSSGAYLFIPSGPAFEFLPETPPEIVLSAGPYESTLTVLMKQDKAAEIALTITLRHNPSLPQTELEITNTFLIDSGVIDYELAMRFSTNIDNKDVFYTDLNGMQMVKRRHLKKLPIQANYYPLSTSAYIEDAELRLTLLTGAPLGVTALRPGEIEVMLDRRLKRDDNRGLGQGIMDNLQTRLTFKLILERANGDCLPGKPLSGQLSLGAHVSQQTLLQPLVVLQFKQLPRAPLPALARLAGPSPGADVVLASFRAHVFTKIDNKLVEGMGMTFQRVRLDTCYGNKDIEKWYPVGNGVVNVSALTGVPADCVREASLTFVRARRPLPGGELLLCPAQVRSVFITFTLKSTLNAKLKFHFEEKAARMIINGTRYVF